MRAAIASAANDHRLGANEAPPAILSVYLGDQLEKVFADIKAGNITKTEKGGVMDLGLSQILTFERDPGDRNRTSPFAFTGNRFEFRAVGSSQSVSGPLITMNTILADSLEWVAKKLEIALGKGADKADAVVVVLKELMELHGNVIFGGNGYSPEWHRMAVEERGLKNLPNTADALPALREQSVQALFERTGVLTPVELESRFKVYAEQYILSIELEAKLVINMAKTLIYPAALHYLTDLSAAASGLSGMGVELDASLAELIAGKSSAMLATVAKLGKALENHDFDSEEAHMQFCATVIRPLMDEVRVYADALEKEVADEHWPLPKYHEMLFIR